MKKQTIIIICVCVVVLAALGIALLGNSSTKGMSFESATKVEEMYNTIYANLEGQLPWLETATLDATDELTLSAYTGLKSSENVEALVVSEPLTGSQAYSSVVVLVKDTADVETMKQEMLDNINMRKWICVSAEKMYITNTGNAIFMVMAAEEWASPVYEEFKKYVNNEVGKELEKTGELEDLPDEWIVE